MEKNSALLAICAGNSPVTGEFPIQRPVTRSFDAFFDLRLNKRLSERSWDWWFETLSYSLWHPCNASFTHIARFRNFARITRFGDKMSYDLASRVSGNNMIRWLRNHMYVQLPTNPRQIKNDIYLKMKMWIVTRIQNASNSHHFWQIRFLQKLGHGVLTIEFTDAIWMGCFRLLLFKGHTLHDESFHLLVS